jgi:hypothetical protein
MQSPEQSINPVFAIVQASPAQDSPILSEQSEHLQFVQAVWYVPPGPLQRYTPPELFITVEQSALCVLQKPL